MTSTHKFLLRWTQSTGEWYLHQFLDGDNTLHPVKTGQWNSIRTGHQLIPIGNYVIDRNTNSNRFRLLQVDISQPDILSSVVTEGDLSSELDPTTAIIPLGNYLLLYWPDTGAYKCKRFDPFSLPLMLEQSSQNIAGTWQTIVNADLIPVAGYVVSRDQNGACRTWMFDGASAKDPLPDPQVRGMQWTIDRNLALCTLGDNIVAWSPKSCDVTIWPVDPTQASPLLPSKQITAWQDSLPEDTVLLGLTPLVPLEVPSGVQGDADGPGTIRWMRQHVKKIVYLMLENRSFDHIFGDLYSQSEVGTFIGSNAPFDGASDKNWNADNNDNRYFQTKFTDQSLNYPTGDPGHTYTEAKKQLLSDTFGNWDRFYPTMFTFADGAQTYCFGQAATDKRWFISTISSNGLGSESANGYWDRFYRTMFSFTQNGTTYCFGQAEDLRWFIAPISKDGIGNEVANGYWDRFYSTMFTFIQNETIYCFGQSDDMRWFISPISNNGPGDETANGYWDRWYGTMFPFDQDGVTYCFGQAPIDRRWFISTISKDGFGDELKHGFWDRFYDPMFSFADGETNYCFGQANKDKRWFISDITKDGPGDELENGVWTIAYPTMFPFLDGNLTCCFCHSSDTNCWSISAINAHGFKSIPHMSGFVESYGSRGQGPAEIMGYYDASALEPLTMLGKLFAVSDAWFSSMPGPTDTNRAFALTGSSFGTVDNFETGDTYLHWPESPRRPSVWDVLWSHGIKDWRLYYHATWGDLRYTDQLFLRGHIQEVDSSKAYQLDINEFMNSAAEGTLASFSFIEPAWFQNSSNAPPNSCHPPTDMKGGLKLVADIYNALRQGPDFDSTLLVVTFDEHGGIYDHVPPPATCNAYRNDCDQDFLFNLLGVRVPTLLISPWIDRATLFRSTQADRHYEATSFIATLLRWYGIQAPNWWLGDRIRAAATFESVFQSEQIRDDAPTSVSAPEFDPKQLDMPMHDLHRLFITRIVYNLCADVLPSEEVEREAQAICALDSMRRAAYALDELERRTRQLR